MTKAKKGTMPDIQLGRIVKFPHETQFHDLHGKPEMWLCFAKEFASSDDGFVCRFLLREAKRGRGRLLRLDIHNTFEAIVNGVFIYELQTQFPSCQEFDDRIQPGTILVLRAVNRDGNQSDEINYQYCQHRPILRTISTMLNRGEVETIVVNSICYDYFRLDSEELLSIDRGEVKTVLWWGFEIDPVNVHLI